MCPSAAYAGVIATKTYFKSTHKGQWQVDLKELFPDINV